MLAFCRSIALSNILTLYSLWSLETTVILGSLRHHWLRVVIEDGTVSSSLILVPRWDPFPDCSRSAVYTNDCHLRSRRLLSRSSSHSGHVQASGNLTLRRSEILIVCLAVRTIEGVIMTDSWASRLPLVRAFSTLRRPRSMQLRHTSSTLTTHVHARRQLSVMHRLQKFDTFAYLYDNYQFKFPSLPPII